MSVISRKIAELSFNISRERGAALFVSLVFLLILTIIGLAGMQNTSLEEKMAGNMRDRSLAFQAAESALRAGEDRLLNPANGSVVFTCAVGNDGVYMNSTQNPSTDCPSTNGWPSNSQQSHPYPASDDRFWQSNTDVVEYSPGGFELLAEKPKYILEDLPPIQSMDPTRPVKTKYYKVTARGVGLSPTTTVVLQSVVRVNK